MEYWSAGVLEEWLVQEMFKNRNRGYQQLRVWSDAIALYTQTSSVFKNWPYELKRVSGQQIASVDSVHRNIAEGYCRRSIREYIQHLYIALGSLGESVSGLQAYKSADQLSEANYLGLNELAFKLENGLIKLVEALETKKDKGDWIDTLMVKESNDLYLACEISAVYPKSTSDTPIRRHSNTPVLQYSITPLTQGGSQ